MVGVIELEIFGGCLAVVWGSSYKVSLGIEDDSGGGPFDARVSNRVFGCESNSKSGVMIQPLWRDVKGSFYRASLPKAIVAIASVTE